MYFCIKFLILKTRKYFATPVQPDSQEQVYILYNSLVLAQNEFFCEKRSYPGRPCITPLPLAPQELSCQNKTKSIDYNRHRISDWINPLTKPSPISFQFFFAHKKTLTSQSRDNFRPFPTKSCFFIFSKFCRKSTFTYSLLFFRFYKKRKNAKA